MSVDQLEIGGLLQNGAFLSFTNCFGSLNRCSCRNVESRMIRGGCWTGWKPRPPPIRNSLTHSPTHPNPNPAKHAHVHPHLHPPTPTHSPTHTHTPTPTHSPTHTPSKRSRSHPYTLGHPTALTFTPPAFPHMHAHTHTHARPSPRITRCEVPWSRPPS